MIAQLLQQAQQDGIEALVVGAYVMRDGKLLLLRRAMTEDFLPGYVELPSGGVDDGETLLEALKLELFEETALQPTAIDRFINSFDYISGTGRKARQFNFAVFISHDQQVTLNPVEHDAYYWVPLDMDALSSYDLSEKTKGTILDAIQQLTKEYQ